MLFFSRLCKPACQIGKVCIDGSCYKVACDKYKECPDGMICKNKNCEPHKCNSKNCPESYRCHGLLNVCIRNTVPVCHKNHFCSPGTGYCINTLCTRRPPIIGCQADDECPKNLPTCSKIYRVCTGSTGIGTVHPYKECMFNNQCPLGMVCMNHWCRDIKNLGYPVCEENKDCRNPNEKCVKSVCRYVDGKVNTCRKDKDCGHNKWCFDEKCHYYIPVGCTKAGDCPLDYPICLDGYCHKKPNQECNHISDCGNVLGQVSCIQNRCVSIQPGNVDTPLTECISNGNCKADSWCLNGMCTTHKPHGACRTDEDCADYNYDGQMNICWAMKCQSMEFPENGCVTDADCPDKRVCYQHACYLGRHRWCNINADCTSNAPICYESLCESDIIPKCDSDDDCPKEWSKCKDKQCIKAESSISCAQCSSNSDCSKSSPFCIKNSCVIDVYEMCVDDFDCRYKDIHHEGTEYGKCLENKWCDSYWDIKVNKIVPAPWTKQACKSDAECRNGIFTKCIRSPFNSLCQISIYCKGGQKF